MVGAIQYGGRVTAEADQRVMDCVVSRFLCPAVVERAAAASAGEVVLFQGSSGGGSSSSSVSSSIPIDLPEKIALTAHPARPLLKLVPR